MKKVILLFFTIFICFFLFYGVSNASVLDDIATESGYSSMEVTSPQIIVAKIIQVALGFMGIGMVVLIFHGGYTWMMSKGDSNEITKAKDTLRNAIIGFAIILSAYAISSMVIKALVAAGGGS